MTTLPNDKTKDSSEPNLNFGFAPKTDVSGAPASAAVALGNAGVGAENNGATEKLNAKQKLGQYRAFRESLYVVTSLFALIGLVVHSVSWGFAGLVDGLRDGLNDAWEEFNSQWNTVWYLRKKIEKLKEDEKYSKKLKSAAERPEPQPD